MNDDFRSALDDIKQRLPIEEVVRWYVPDLKRQGALWVACCPFHSEKTPSFKVDPRRGTWHCYGACSTGGDQIAFVERANRVEFLEALEILASRAGVSLPDRRSRDGRREEDENQPLYDVLARAERFFRRRLRTPEGARALEYMRSRGLSDRTLEAFGVGWAGRGGQDGLVALALGQGVALKTLVAAGLAREGDGHGSGPGRASDFFFGRVTFPVRDRKGRTVGFGARRLDEAAGGPKYVNTPETVLFHKGRLIYGLDRALASVRRGGHLVLVEGYTDVMAAHQVGLEHVAAVLGTATTDEHAALVRRSGARRVSLVFDGDEAGRRATHKALHGLLPLEVEIDVVRLPGGEDPCDLLVRPDGAAAFARALEQATGWFEHLAREVEGLDDELRWREIDLLLGLIARLGRPLEREGRIEELAARLGVPAESVRAQLESLPERRREALRRREVETPAAPVPASEADRRLRRDWRLLVGAVLADPELAAEAEAWRAGCPYADLQTILGAVLAAAGEQAPQPVRRVAPAEALPRVGSSAEDTPPAEEPDDGARWLHAVLAHLGESAVRHEVVSLLEEAGQYENARELFADAEHSLRARELERELEREKDLLRSGGDPADERERMLELYAKLRSLKTTDRGAARTDSPARVS